MGRHPDTRADRIRKDWVYVGMREAAVLGGVSQGTIERLIYGGPLRPAAQAVSPAGGRARNLYRLDEVFTALRERRR